MQLVALSITVYMLFQGIAPSLWGPLADSYGRRPILLSTLIVYILANLGLALAPSFKVLMLFRGIQAVGSASTIAIGAGVIGDIAVAGERGGFMGLFGGSKSDHEMVNWKIPLMLRQFECLARLLDRCLEALWHSSWDSGTRIVMLI
jgi:MFS family permease